LIVAVVSGKGGTGKTTVAASLARAWCGERPVLLADCDVDGPNAHHFLPDLGKLAEEPVQVPVPRIDEDLCNHCGACADACRYNALAVTAERVLLFESLCHSCGACGIVCPEEAISERLRSVGILRRGLAGDLPFLQGDLAVGEAQATPVVEAVIEAARVDAGLGADIVLDGPPGASCPVAAVVGAADVCLLVTEPTPFGLHDLEQAALLIALRGKPAAVVLNRACGGEGDELIESWCRKRGIPLLLSIPDRRSIAEAYASGAALIDSLPGIAAELAGLRQPLQDLAAGGRGRATA